MRARSISFAVVAVLALALVWVTAAYGADAAPSDDRTASAVDQAAAADATGPGADETVAANKQSVQGNGQAQDDEVSTAQVDGKDGDNDDKRVKKAATDRDCSDFEFQEGAQDYFDRKGGSATNDVDNLDADHDGLACERLPSRSGAPVGGPDTGGGGTAPPPDGGSSAGPLPFVLGGAAVGLLIALFGPSLRRRVTT